MAGSNYRYAHLVAAHLEVEVDYSEEPDFKLVRQLAVRLLAVTLINQRAYDAHVEAIDKPTEQEANDEAFDEFARLVQAKEEAIFSRLASLLT